MTYIIEIKTVQASAFRILVEALKEILVDANLECDETGIKMIAMANNIHIKVFVVGISFSIA